MDDEGEGGDGDACGGGKAFPKGVVAGGEGGAGGADVVNQEYVPGSEG